MTTKPEFPKDLPDADHTSPSTNPGLGAETVNEPSGRLSNYGRTTRRLAQQIQSAQTQQQQLSRYLATLDKLRMNISQSFDSFSLASTQRSLSSDLYDLDRLALDSASSIERAIDAQAFRRSVAQDTDLFNSSLIGSAIAAMDQVHDVIKSLSTPFVSMLASIDVGQLFQQIDRLIPSNLHGVGNLDAVASLALDEGIPLCWVPRAEIVTALIEANESVERQQILMARREDILDDCETVLRSIRHELSSQCSKAIEALRQGLDGPAQSHASNIVDSIVINGPGRATAVDSAHDDFDELPLYLIRENLVLRPLVRTLTRWFPDSGDPPPKHFARHATSHAVGYTGVFDPLYALIGIMLATSLTVQYAPLMRRNTDTDSCVSVTSAGKPI